MHQKNNQSQAKKPYDSCHMPAIDWHAQWSNCGAIEKEGYFEIPLNKVIKNQNTPLKMLAGAGFGDLTHPTTILTLKLMASLVPGCCFIDIGSGSGILSLAAAKLGAKQIIGIDIDENAIGHALANAILNGLNIPYSFTKASEMPPLSKEPLVIAMNMIYTEQQLAWQSVPKLHIQGINCITSGILQEHKDFYLGICQNFGWHLVATLKSKQWLAFHFVT